MSAIREWLRSLGLSEYADVFGRERIDLGALCGLSDADLRDLGLPIGPRSKLRTAIDALRTQGTSSASEQPAAPPSAAEVEAARRIYPAVLDPRGACTP